jgi:hypothetical protein
VHVDRVDVDRTDNGCLPDGAPRHGSDRRAT